VELNKVTSDVVTLFVTCIVRLFWLDKDIEKRKHSSDRERTLRRLWTENGCRGHKLLLQATIT